jgi:dienelactone hydrolase
MRLRLASLVAGVVAAVGMLAEATPQLRAVEPAPPPLLATFCLNSPDQYACDKDGPEKRGAFLWLPPGAGPFPTVVYHHGSEQAPGSIPGPATALVAEGFAVFVPHRRGHGQSNGLHVGRNYVDGRRSEDEVLNHPEILTNAMIEQLSDQRAAIEYLRTVTKVDQGRIASMGCSYGGIQAALALGTAPPDRPNFDYGYRAAVVFSPGTYVFGSTEPLREKMKESVSRATIPVFLIQAANEARLDPSFELARAIHNAKSEELLRLTIFPTFGGTIQDGHSLCDVGASIWSADVVAFLRQAMPR